MTSISLTRSLLYGILDDIHRKYRPVEIRTWVDDCFQMHRGPAAVILPHALQVAIAFVARLKRFQLPVSGKSVIVSSDINAGKQLQDQLAASGINISFDDRAKDLGVDHGAGSRRRVTVQATRLLNAGRARKQVCIPGRHTKQARKLAITAVKPRLYGFAAMGASPTMAKKARAAYGGAAALRKAGGCQTVAIHSGGLQHGDPGLCLPFETVTDCIDPS